MTEATQLSEALDVMREFFELHPNGAELDADLCAYFRDAMRDSAEKAAEMESIIRGAIKFGRLMPPEPPQTYDYNRALQHQQNRELVRKRRETVMDGVVAFPKELRGA